MHACMNVVVRMRIVTSIILIPVVQSSGPIQQMVTRTLVAMNQINQLNVAVHHQMLLKSLQETTQSTNKVTKKKLYKAKLSYKKEWEKIYPWIFCEVG